MIGEHWTPGGQVDARLRRLQDELLGLAATATMTADEDVDFEGVLDDEHRALVCSAVDGVTEQAARAVDHQLDGEPFEVTMVGYTASTPGVFEIEEQSLQDAVERLRAACARWWRRLDELGLSGESPVPHPDRPGATVEDLVLDLVELTAIAVGEVTALLELRA